MRRYLFAVIAILIVLAVWLISRSDLLPITREKIKTINNQGATVSAYVITGNATVTDEVQVVRGSQGRDTVIADIRNYNFIVDLFFKNSDTVGVVVRDTSMMGTDRTVYLRIDNKK